MHYAHMQSTRTHATHAYEQVHVCICWPDKCVMHMARQGFLVWPAVIPPDVELQGSLAAVGGYHWPPRPTTCDLDDVCAPGAAAWTPG